MGRSVVIEDGDVFILVNEDYFGYQQVLVTVKFSFEYLVYQEVDASLEWDRGLFKQIVWYPGESRGFVRWPSLYEQRGLSGFLDSSFSLFAIVRKSNVPALSEKILSFVRCLVLRKCVRSMRMHSLAAQK